MTNLTWYLFVCNLTIILGLYQNTTVLTSHPVHKNYNNEFLTHQLMWVYMGHEDIISERVKSYVISRNNIYKNNLHDLTSNCVQLPTMYKTAGIWMWFINICRKSLYIIIVPSLTFLHEVLTSDGNIYFLHNVLHYFNTC